MSNAPELPHFKPVVKLVIKKATDRYPDQLPFFDEEFIYCYAATNERDYLDDPVKLQAWKDGEIESPDFWWLSAIRKGRHSNFGLAKTLCDGQPPEEVTKLYHPVWQLRLALGRPVGSLIEEAKNAWANYWVVNPLH
jgi:hypothetical protein